MKQNQTDMIQLRRNGLQSVNARWRRGYLTARMGFRHPHVPALLGHLLATLAFGRCHRRSRQHASRDRQRSQRQRQSGNTDFDQPSHNQQSICHEQKDATTRKRFQLPPSRDRPKRLRIERNASAAPSFSLVLEFECSRGHQLWKCREAIYNDDAQLEDMHRPMSKSSSSKSLPFVAVRRSWPSGIATMRCRRWDSPRNHDDSGPHLSRKK